MTTCQAQDEFLSAVLSPVPAVAAGLRLYQLNRQALVNRALAVTFPVTQLLLGAGFDSAAQQFIQSRPLQSADWALVGQDFPLWLEQQAELQSVAYVSAIALLEWQIFHLQRAADPHIDITSLRLLEHYSTDELSVQVHPLCVSMQSGFPLYQIWLYHQLPSDPAQLTAIRHALSLTDYVEHILLTRPQFKAEITRLTPDQMDMFNLCRAGCSLSQLLQALAARNLDFSQWLAQMLKIGAVTGFSLLPASDCTDLN